MAASTPLNVSEKFEIIVDLLKHEDNLISLRTNWALVFQGFLFTAFAATLGLFEKFNFSDPTATPLHAGLFLVCVIGMMSCFAAFFGVRAAEDQQIALRGWWEKNGEMTIENGAEKPNSDYPPLYPLKKLKSKLRASKLFLVLMGMWFIILVTVLCSSSLVPANKNCPNQPKVPTCDSLS